MAEEAVTKRKTDKPAETRPAPEAPVFVPRVDIRENEAEVVVVADMPGVDEQSVTIDLEGTRLCIRGTFVPQAPTGYSVTYQEYDMGNYERSFTLGDIIDRDAIRAVVKDGVLRLTLPKAREVQPKRIAVRAG